MKGICPLMASTFSPGNTFVLLVQAKQELLVSALPVIRISPNFLLPKIRNVFSAFNPAPSSSVYYRSC